MYKLKTIKTLTTVNFLIVIYFVIVYILYLYKVDVFFIGVLRELLSIPFLIAQIVFLVNGIVNFKKHQRNVWFIISLVTLAVCTVITIGSFY
jgi:hypothetical protein